MIHICCGTEGCDWRVSLRTIEENGLERCRARFREHCVERHGLDPEDTGRYFFFDLETWKFTLLGKRVDGVAI